MGYMPFIGIVFIDAHQNVWQTRVWADQRAGPKRAQLHALLLCLIFAWTDGQAIGRNRTRHARRFAAGRHIFVLRCVFGELWVFLPCVFLCFGNLKQKKKKQNKTTRWNSSIQAFCSFAVFRICFHFFFLCSTDAGPYLDTEQEVYFTAAMGGSSWWWSCQCFGMRVIGSSCMVFFAFHHIFT